MAVEAALEEADVAGDEAVLAGVEAAAVAGLEAAIEVAAEVNDDDEEDDDDEVPPTWIPSLASIACTSASCSGLTARELRRATRAACSKTAVVWCVAHNVPNPGG